jgi:integrase
VRRVDPPKYRRPEAQTLSLKQTRELLKAAIGHPFEAFVRLAIVSGMREGELFALRWPDVDLAHRAIYAQHSLENVSGKRKIVNAKTDGSRRRIDLTPDVVASLRAHQKRTAKAKSEFVFHDSRGGSLSRHNFVRAVWKPLLEDAGLPAVRIHDLRHGMATLMLQAGVHPKVVQERLGHSRIATTLDLYSHLAPTMQADAAKRLGTLLTRRAGVKSGGQAKSRSRK